MLTSSLPTRAYISVCDFFSSVIMEGLVNNIHLFNILKEELQSLSDSEQFFNYLKQKLNLTFSQEDNTLLRKFCQKFCYHVNARWEKSNRTLANFLRRNGDWLESPIIWPASVIVCYQQENEDTTLVQPINDGKNIEYTPSSESLPAIPIVNSKKSFQELCLKQKKRRIEHINKSLSPQELTAATVKNFKDSGNEDITKILEYLTNHPEDIQRVKYCVFKKNTEENAYSAEAALGLLMSLNLSKRQYIHLRMSARERGCHLYPSYYRVQQAKVECYPKKEDMFVSAEGARLNLQALLDLTAERLLKAVDLDAELKTDYQLISKWGFGGASGQSSYKQKSSKNFDDSSVFMASLVPIRLLRDGVVMWENDRLSSTWYCRPMMFKCMKETQASVEIERALIYNEIDALCSSKIKEVSVKHQLLMTMIDGKICSYLSETSSTTCGICKAKPAEINQLNVINNKAVNEEIYQYGLSSLHAWIRCMECLLHIGMLFLVLCLSNSITYVCDLYLYCLTFTAYRLEFKKWSARGEDKLKMQLRKEEIQTKFKNECGLLIDVVKQGSGSTNDGNTARRFFSDAKTAASITGIDENIIKRFHVILQAIASGEHINLFKFSNYCKETATLYIQLYSWYYMPSSIHKLLIHGPKKYN